MTWSQTIVVSWLQFMVTAALLLQIGRLSLRWLHQPVDRIRLILCSMIAVTAIPLFIAVAPWPIWHLRLITPVDAESVPSRPATIQSNSMPIANSPNRELAEGIPSEESLSRGAVDSSTRTIDSHEARPTVSTAATMSLPSPSIPPRSDASIWSRLAVAIGIVHGLGIVYFLLEWSLGFYWIRRLSRNSSPAPADVQQTWGRMTEGGGRHVRLLMSPAIDAPLTYGSLRPVVMLPLAFTDASATTLAFCLAHEWSHIRRQDMVAWSFIRSCQYLFWLQPSYWALRAELRLQQDMLADDHATRAKNDAIEYSELLIGFAKSRMSAPVAGALTFLDHPTQLMKRIKMLLENPMPVRARSSWTFSLTSATLAALAVALITGIRLDSTIAADAAKGTSQATATDVPTPSTAKSESPKTESKAVEAATPAEKATAAKEAPIPPTPPVTEQNGPLHYTCRVVNKETMEGIPNARIVFRRSVLTSQENRIIEETKHTTDKEGKYEVEIPADQVAIGSLYIELDVEHDDYTSKVGHGYALGMIRKNEKLGERPFFETTEIYPAGTVTGTIVAPDGTPLPGVKVQGFSRAKRMDWNSGSFSDTLSDTNGKFRLNLHKDIEGVIWILPKDYAPVEKYLAKQRGELGTFKLTPGVRLKGRVTDAAGSPLSGIAVNIDYTGANEFGELAVATSIRRGSLSDAEGRFSFDPLSTGDYRVAPSEHLSNPLVRDRTVYAVPGVFVSTTVSLKEGSEANDIEVQAVPHVVLNGQLYDSKGKKRGGHPISIFGQFDGTWWHTMGRPEKDGLLAVRIPHGLQQVKVQLSSNEHQALRYRRGKDQPLENLGSPQGIEFGTLNDDIDGFEIIYYKAPIVLVSIVDDEQKPIPDARVSGAYTWGTQSYVLKGETRSDISFDHQEDGRFRTSQMVPDEDLTFTATAPGYEAVSEKVKLQEGETKDLVLTLKKAAKDTTEEAKAPAVDAVKASNP
ncbi:M56 family metallopeptidase [Schlesneria paludicola]|uniref:M56 family metallopeptidase n=1 Tax=Schlesneria paludicola TaxID=360056 RepID=UPI00029A20BC|nr:M56 family metallopeptidase [Schlesneria paludicola]